MGEFVAWVHLEKQRKPAVYPRVTLCLGVSSVGAFKKQQEIAPHLEIVLSLRPGKTPKEVLMLLLAVDQWPCT